MSLFQGVQLVNAKGEKKDGEECVAGKTLALYFAADWCPDCRSFQPALNDFYKDVNKDGAKLELVFVGSDRSEEDQIAHFENKQGPWWMISYDNALRNELKRKYGVCAGKEQVEVGVTERKGGIPSLVVVQPNGDLVDLHGAEKVESDGVQAFASWQ
ncbi:hypothetical protein Poli38472_000180 [Pythium oligandrum]|uniref:Thioredoxin domain-containing protein n=1 Tax=Pythium oligandrum TaxID=41045 RepID=A0A8K1CBV0_PYTOL|nr:hypothetical protein Poli38472_000180 [Pythium oligandrum]|eukprot:TMW60138.1 hypothetical protein Poli38472_000180 [Pythium oligandrum]